MTPPLSALFRIYAQLRELNFTDSSRKNTPPSVAVFPSNKLYEKLIDDKIPDNSMLPRPLDVLFSNLELDTIKLPPLSKVIILSLLRLLNLKDES
jgi:hypothetical protein